jgi:hypothetical protein
MTQEPKTYRKLEDELWEAYTAGVDNGHAHAVEGEEPNYDMLREDFAAWLEQRDA